MLNSILRLYAKVSVFRTDIIYSMVVELDNCFFFQWPWLLGHWFGSLSSFFHPVHMFSLGGSKSSGALHHNQILTSQLKKWLRFQKFDYDTENPRDYDAENKFDFDTENHFNWTCKQVIVVSFEKMLDDYCFCSGYVRYNSVKNLETSATLLCGFKIRNAINMGRKYLKRTVVIFFFLKILNSFLISFL